MNTARGEQFYNYPIFLLLLQCFIKHIDNAEEVKDTNEQKKLNNVANCLRFNLELILNVLFIKPELKCAV